MFSIRNIILVTILTFYFVLIMVPASSIMAADVDFTRPFEADEYTLALWHFDQQAGDTIVPDSSGHGNDATTKTGFHSVTLPDPEVGELDPGRTWVSSMDGFGKCAYTYYNSEADSNIGTLIIPNGSNSLSIGRASDLTIECWVRPQEDPANWWRTIVVMHSGADYMLGLMAESTDVPYPTVSWYAPGHRIYQDTQALDADTWTHLAVTVDRTSEADTDTVRFFHNGVFTVEYRAPRLGYYTYRDKHVYIMGRYGQYSRHSFIGYLDELRISNCIRPYGGFPGVGANHPQKQKSKEKFISPAAKKSNHENVLLNDSKKND